MDPTETQADKSNDSHSLEQSDGTEATGGSTPPAGDDAPKADASGVVDATGGTNGTPPPPKKKNVPFIKRFWHKFNIYLLLLVLIIVIAVAILVFLTVKGKQTAQNALKTQNLSQSVLQQLASTDVSVGNTKQILTVQSNAIFAGAVLVRSDMEIAGSLQVGGTLNIANLDVTGATQLGDVKTNNLTVAGSLNLQGQLTLKSGINVTGDSNFAGNLTVTQLTTGSLALNGDLNLTHHITAGGTIPIIVKGTAVGGGGTVSLSGSDTSGSITINTGSSPPAGCFATITFSKAFSTTPHIVVTPIGQSAAGLQYYVTRSTTGFLICGASAAPSGDSFGFDYIALD
ncbi:MAG TPA: hypothetical protein VLF91_04820 [Candidatus Saccharimonadales bacterium]|nr:hypothetical protein [Candidatus Saccharimonadales bacterium]